VPDSVENTVAVSLILRMFNYCILTKTTELFGIYGRGCSGNRSRTCIRRADAMLHFHYRVCTNNMGFVATRKYGSCRGVAQTGRSFEATSVLGENLRATTIFVYGRRVHKCVCVCVYLYMGAHKFFDGTERKEIREKEEARTSKKKILVVYLSSSYREKWRICFA